MTFLQLVGENRLVILDGRSGVGKSSLLQASLVPVLREKLYAVAECSDWSDVADLEAHDLLGAKIFAALATDPLFTAESMPMIDTFSANAEIFDELEADREAHGRRTVAILDQFEELIRDAPARASAVIDVLAKINNHYSLTVVVSLRSEYLHELRRLERTVRAFSYATYELEPISDNLAEDVICAPNTRDKDGLDSCDIITEDAAERIAGVWKDARRLDHESGRSVDEIGLLHLQAALYSLHWDSSDREGALSLNHVEDFLNREDEGGHRRGPVEVFEDAMVDAVNRKLDHCTTAAKPLVDTSLLSGAKSYVARIAPHLSSGGFKLRREAAELAERAINEELVDLGAADNQWAWEPLLRAMLAQIGDPNSTAEVADTEPANEVADLIGDTWYELVRKLAGVDLAEQLLHEMSEELDTEGRSSGVMLGMPHSIVLVEELRRLALAMAFMAHSHLVRKNTPSPDRTMISLIHDRLGQGLAKWSRPVRGHPSGTIHAITAPQAGLFLFKGTSALSGRPDNVKLIANLRWRGAFISADFRHVVLANCDFRGTMFKNCSFEGVAFMNCRLEGTMFESCRVIGADVPALDINDDRPSSFDLDGHGLNTGDFAGSLARYWLLPTESGLWSFVPGRPVEMLSTRPSDDGTTKVTNWAPPVAGLVVYGGRVSTLVFRRTTFDGTEPSESMLAFRHVAGSGLEIAEQADSGSFEFYASALRHLSITPARRSASEPSPQSVVKVSIARSAVAQTWFGEHLNGQAQCSASLLVQMWNNSTDFDVSVSESSYQGLVGCDVSSGTPLSIAEVVVDAADLDPSILDRTAVMNFVQDPSRLT